MKRNTLKRFSFVAVLILLLSMITSYGPIVTAKAEGGSTTLTVHSNTGADETASITGGNPFLIGDQSHEGTFELFSWAVILNMLILNSIIPAMQFTNGILKQTEVAQAMHGIMNLK